MLVYPLAKQSRPPVKPDDPSWGRERLYVAKDEIAAVVDVDDPSEPRDWRARIILRTGQEFVVAWSADEIRRAIDGSEPMDD